MIVAIASSAAGQQPVIEFRQAADTASAVLAYCNEYSPPLDPADFVGVDTGWSDPDPRLGYIWAWDSVGAVLVEIDYQPWLIQQIDAQRDYNLATSIRAEYPAASGLLFSCSVPAQDSWSKLATLDARGLVSYPFKVHTYNQEASYDLVDSADLTGAIGSISAAVLAERNLAQTYIDAVVAAPDGDAARAAAAPYLGT